MSRNVRPVILCSVLVLLVGCPSDPDSGVTIATKTGGTKSTPAPSANPNVTGGVSSGGSSSDPSPAATLAPAPTPSPEPYLVSTFGVTSPGALAVDAAGSFWVGSSHTAPNSTSTVNTLYKLSATGTVLASTSLSLAPRAIAVDASNNVYATDGQQLQKFDSTGSTVGAAVSFNSQPGGAAIAIDGLHNRIWLVGGSKAFTFSTGLAAQNTYAFGATASANPVAIALDNSGNAWIVGGTDAALINAGASNDTFAAVKNFNLWATSLQAVLVTGTSIWIAQPGIYVAQLGTDGTELHDYLAGKGASSLTLDGSGNVLAATPTGVTKLSTSGATLASYIVNEGIASLLFSGTNAWFTSTGGNALFKATF